MSTEPLDNLDSRDVDSVKDPRAGSARARYGRAIEIGTVYISASVMTLVGAPMTTEVQICGPKRSDGCRPLLVALDAFSAMDCFALARLMTAMGRKIHELEASGEAAGGPGDDPARGG